MLLGGSEIAAHTASANTKLKDDGSIPIIVGMFSFFLLCFLLYGLTDMPFGLAFFISSAVLIVVSVPYVIIRRRRRNKILQEIQLQQLQDMENASSKQV